MGSSTPTSTAPCDWWSDGPSFGVFNLVFKNANTFVFVRKMCTLISRCTFYARLPHFAELWYLGVWFDESLTWRLQICESVSRVKSMSLVASALGRPGLGIGPLFVPLARQRVHPPHDVLWSPMLGICFVFEDEVGRAGLGVGVCCTDGIQT